MIAQNRPRAHNPSDIGQPEKTIVFAMVEAEPDFLAHLRQTSGVRMYRALRLAGGPAGIQDERAMLRIERQRLVIGWPAAKESIPRLRSHHDRMLRQRRHLLSQWKPFSPTLQVSRNPA